MQVTREKAGESKPFAYFQIEAYALEARLSPDDQLLAYSSKEGKRHEVYVRTFPDPSGKWQISVNGGTKPVWRRDGKELYFIEGNQTVMAVEVRNNGRRFEPGVPKPLFHSRISNANGTAFDVTRDGRFLMPIEFTQFATHPMTLVINWPAALKK